MSRQAVGLVWMMGLVLAASLALAGRDMIVNGHTFSQLTVCQQGSTVTVSGRIQGGPDKYPMRASIFVQNNLGQIVETAVTVDAYTGGPATFSESFPIHRPARKWSVVAVKTN